MLTMAKGLWSLPTKDRIRPMFSSSRAVRLRPAPLAIFLYRSASCLGTAAKKTSTVRTDLGDEPVTLGGELEAVGWLREAELIMDQSIMTSLKGKGIYFLASKGIVLARSFSERYGKEITVEKVEKEGIEATALLLPSLARLITSLIPQMMA